MPIRRIIISGLRKTAGEEIAAYPFDRFWLDIGRLDDYQRTVTGFEQQSPEFLSQQGSGWL